MTPCVNEWCYAMAGTPAHHVTTLVRPSPRSDYSGNKIRDWAFMYNMHRKSCVHEASPCKMLQLRMLRASRDASRQLQRLDAKTTRLCPLIGRCTRDVLPTKRFNGRQDHIWCMNAEHQKEKRMQGHSVSNKITSIIAWEIEWRERQDTVNILVSAQGLFLCRKLALHVVTCLPGFISVAPLLDDEHLRTSKSWETTLTFAQLCARKENWDMNA
jgi:hypothetical protein